MAGSNTVTQHAITGLEQSSAAAHHRLILMRCRFYSNSSLAGTITGYYINTFLKTVCNCRSGEIYTHTELGLAVGEDDAEDVIGGFVLLLIRDRVR